MLAYNQLPIPFQKHMVDEIGKIAGRNCLVNNPDYGYMKFEIEKHIEKHKPLISNHKIIDFGNGKLELDFTLYQGWKFNMLIDPEIIRSSGS